MVKAASEATQKLTTAGSSCHHWTRRTIKTGGVTRVQKSWLPPSCWICDGRAVVRSWSLRGTNYNQRHHRSAENREGLGSPSSPIAILDSSLPRQPHQKARGQGLPAPTMAFLVKFSKAEGYGSQERQYSCPASFSTHQVQWDNFG